MQAESPLEFPDHPLFVQGEEVVRWLRHPETVAFAYERNRSMFLFLTLVSTACLVLVLALFLRSDERGILQLASATVLGATSIGCAWAFVHWFFYSVRTYVALRPGGIIVGRGERAWLIPGDQITRESIDFERMQRGTHTIVLPLNIPPATVQVLLLNPFVELRHHRSFLAEILSLLIDEDTLDPAEDPSDEVEENDGRSGDTSDPPTSTDRSRELPPSHIDRKVVLEQRARRRKRT